MHSKKNLIHTPKNNHFVVNTVPICLPGIRYISQEQQENWVLKLSLCVLKKDFFFFFLNASEMISSASETVLCNTCSLKHKSYWNTGLQSVDIFKGVSLHC